jgi:tetratricopeptide (TPR) repeat protein
MSPAARRSGARAVALALAGALALSASPVRAGEESPQEIFARANALYAEESYGDALSLYKEILDGGREAPEVYFNASNCYLRLGHPGLALVYCERAARLAPGDEDIEANLSFIKSLVREGAPEPEGSRLLDAVLLPYRSLTIDGAAVTASASLFALAALLAVSVATRGRRRLMRYLIACALAALVVSSVQFGAKLWGELSREEAVVIVSQAYVRSGPGEDFVVQTSLGEGAEVLVKRSGGEWTEISLGPDLAGWVKSSSLEII